jgi:cytochrome c5
LVDSNGAESNYKKTCATCHNAGIAGAPKFADAAQWESRIAKGMDTLYTSSISGMPPGMPAKGMCFSCSDDDLKAIVDYMVEAVK